MNRLVKSAKIRAAVQSLLGSVPGPLDVKEIEQRLPQHPEIRELGDLPALEPILGRMGKQGLIMRAGRIGKMALWGPAASPPTPKTKHHQPPVNITLIKSSGRVRIELGGLLIEIGVTE